MKVPLMVKKLLFGYKATSETYIAYLRKMGASVGVDVEIFRPFQTTIDMTAPYLLSIGDHVQITGPVTILTHDYSWCVLKRKYGDICGNQRRTFIGSNVFIGWGAIILGGAFIGDNTIIGAGAVVSGRLEGNAVYGGNPAQKIMSLEEFYHKRRDRQLEEAVTLVLEYRKKYGKMPPREELHEYFFLFENGGKDMPEVFRRKLELMCNPEKSRERLGNQKVMFREYDAFLAYCSAEIDDN